MKSARWVITYVVVASLGLWGAFFMSLRFMTPGRAQNTPEQAQKMEPPSPGDLPPEFAQETQQAPPANGQIPPPPTQPPQPEAVAPPPPSQPGMPPMAPPMVPAQTVIDSSAGPVVPQFASDEQYTYDPTGRRDPFKPYKAYRPPPPPTAVGQTKVIDESDPLQKWNLDRFEVLAIIWEVRQPKAMLKDPDGKTYMIGKNTKIGRNSGRVVAIREGEVLVVEEIETEGVQTKEVKILELKK